MALPGTHLKKERSNQYKHIRGHLQVLANIDISVQFSIQMLKFLDYVYNIYFYGFCLFPFIQLVSSQITN